MLSKASLSAKLVTNLAARLQTLSLQLDAAIVADSATLAAAGNETAASPFSPP
jgi:hypothetical protein